jgi:hypothetical protein
VVTCSITLERTADNCGKDTSDSASTDCVALLIVEVSFISCIFLNEGLEGRIALVANLGDQIGYSAGRSVKELLMAKLEPR